MASGTMVAVELSSSSCEVKAKGRVQVDGFIEQ